jgi:hypothetical protein
LAGKTEVLGENLPQRYFCPTQNPHDQTRVWTRAAAVESRRLTAWAMARPSMDFIGVAQDREQLHVLLNVVF